MAFLSVSKACLLIHYSYQKATAPLSLFDQDIYFQCTKHYKNKKVQLITSSGIDNPTQKVNHVVAHFDVETVNVIVEVEPDKIGCPQSLLSVKSVNKAVQMKCAEVWPSQDIKYISIINGRHKDYKTQHINIVQNLVTVSGRKLILRKYFLRETWLCLMSVKIS